MDTPRQCRLLARRCRTAALATSIPGSGHPYVSLVNLATDPIGRPLLLLSRLAVHTQNLLADRRASLLVREPEPLPGNADPLTGLRMTVLGTLEQHPEARERYLDVHPGAALYAGFADFSFWRLAIDTVHAVAGFGRITTFTGDDLLVNEEAAVQFASIERGAAQHMNEDHTDAIADYARLLGEPEGDWRMACADLDGLDLSLGERTVRLAFPRTLSGPAELRPMLIDLVKQARLRA
jgi:heme iron utilization protein